MTTRRFGLIGFPLTHSFSRKFFTEKFETEQIDAEYLNFEIENIGLFPEIIAQTNNLCGLNVTIPYKEKVMPFLNQLDDAAKTIGAVNTITVQKTGAETILKGFNTDVTGFAESIKPMLKASHQKALVLGTGGASKAVVFALNSMGIETTMVSRTSQHEQVLTYQNLTSEVMASNTVIVNTTPLGTYPNTDSFPPIPYHELGAGHLLYDLVYNPAETQFLLKGKEKGAAVKNGMDMLRLQALAAWEIWNR